MRFPILQEISRQREIVTTFGGYNHQISCQEGQFFDMKNMTSSYFPVLSPRDKRGFVKKLNNPQGILDKEDLWWIDDNKLYKNGEEVVLDGVTITDGQKVMAKMGAYIIIMPDKIWINSKDSDTLECGYMENTVTVKGVTISICNESGKVIEWKDSEYYKTNSPKDGDYQMSVNSDGKPSLKVYSASTSIWMTVASTYVQISANGIGKGFSAEDGVKITSDYVGASLDNIFINKEEDGLHCSTNTYILDRKDNAITIPGILNTYDSAFENMTLTIERKVPEMAYITECNNRLWGCSKDGHEIYCCKLGDVKNWNLFRGNSMDSWAATIGSDGKFTGAITYLGYPIFFKEDSLIKIAVSSTGGHQTKETMCRGVQSGSAKSLVILNENLYYKSNAGVCLYNGSLPYSISDELGKIKYYNAVAGATGDKYYISMCDKDNKYSLFVYDTKNGIWCKEDDTNAIVFCKYKDELYYIDSSDNVMKSVGGTLLYATEEKATEGNFDWFVESAPIGYSSPDKKYVGRINICLSMDVGSETHFYLCYDSEKEWEHKFSVTGTGTKTLAFPLIPKRCNLFKYKISGKGNCKIHSITKSIEGGSDGR